MNKPIFAGNLSVLNCGAGDIYINFAKEDPEDVKRAKKMITDMLARGYAIFIQEPNTGKLKKVHKFDARRNHYIVKEVVDADTDQAPEETSKAKGRKTKTRQTRHDIRRSKATAVAPTAGG